MSNQRWVVRWLGIFIFFFACLQPARAEINIGESLEWMTVDSPLIVRGVVADVKDSSPKELEQPQWFLQEVTIKIHEVLKGDYSKEMVSFKRLHTGLSDAHAWLKSNSEMLFFLVEGKGISYGFDFTGSWRMRGDYPTHPIKLTSEEAQIVLSDMRVIKDPQDILQRIRDRVKIISGPNFQPYRVPNPELVSSGFFTVPNGAVILEVPAESEAWKVLWSGSACYLVVPADEEYKTLALKLAQSSNYEQRLKGADLLGSYPGDDTVGVLKNLLNDPGTHEVTYGSMAQGQRIVPVYGVRETAYHSLQRLGVAVDKPVLKKE